MNRHGLKSIAFAAALGLTTVLISQCRMVDDNIMGVDLKSNQSVSGRQNCTKGCEEKAKDARNAEESRHKSAERACGSDKACKKSEEDRHKANQDAIEAAFKECKRGCYNEGGGQGR